DYPVDWPSWASTIRILRDSVDFKFYGTVGDTTHYDRRRLVNETFDRLVGELSQDFPEEKDWNWGDRKTTDVRHLARVLAPFNRPNIVTDGINHVLNATTRTHGPSWRMIVELGDKPKAIGVYPGGQTGNPGNPKYDAFIDTWAEGQYFEL
ncbi:MAG: penicillin acylase family protein, partial [Bacteroidia bacterium]|nr:penicillin acylase family protein [Bacteroidia bacterium]